MLFTAVFHVTISLYIHMYAAWYCGCKYNSLITHNISFNAALFYDVAHSYISVYIYIICTTYVYIHLFLRYWILVMDKKHEGESHNHHWKHIRTHNFKYV